MDKLVSKLLRKDLALRNWLATRVDQKFADDGLLIEELKDGVQLCVLMQRLKPTSVPDIKLSPCSPQDILQNFIFFTSACEDAGVPPHLIPAPEVWMEASSPVRLYTCLHKLVRFVNVYLSS